MWGPRAPLVATLVGAGVALRGPARQPARHHAGCTALSGDGSQCWKRCRGCWRLRRVKDEHTKDRARTGYILCLLCVCLCAQWDNKLIADGTPGETTLLIRTMMKKDWVYREGSDQHTEVPYGYLTGMGL